jgi:hypothetical protein
VVQCSEFLATDSEDRVRFAAPPDFLRSSGLERDPLIFESTIEELLGRKSSASGLETLEYGRRDPSRWQRGILYLQKLALTSLTSGGRSRTKATEFFLHHFNYFWRPLAQSRQASYEHNFWFSQR